MAPLRRWAQGAAVVLGVAAGGLGLAAPRAGAATGSQRPIAGAASSARSAPLTAASCTGAFPACGNVALFNREAYSYHSALTPAAEARRYSVIVLMESDAGLVPALKAANPRLKVLLYTDILRSSQDTFSDASMCTDGTQDLQNDPDWFLKDANGQDVLSPATAVNPASYHMDIGNPGYQTACATNAALAAAAGGFDGVFMDGVDGSMAYGFARGTMPTVPEYPNDATWQAAMTRFVHAAGTAVHAHKLLVFGNIGGAAQALWAALDQPLDGGEDESFADGGGGPASALWWWPINEANLAWSEAHGKYVIEHSHSTTELNNVFGLASMLLYARGHASYSTSNANYWTDEEWYGEYSLSERLGAPTGAARRLSSGVYERFFANGLVVVNPTTAIRRVAFGGRYTGTHLWHARSATLHAASALIMVRG